MTPSTRNEPDGFIEALAFAARWCAGFSNANLPTLIASLRATNAFEESPTQYKLLSPAPMADGDDAQTAPASSV